MQPQKINPHVLRTLVIFPNAMNYMLAFGIGIFIYTNMEEIEAQGGLTFWMSAFFIVLAVGIITTFTIIRKIRNGQM